MKCLPLANENGKNCVFRVVRVSGTIRKVEEEAIRRARDLILQAQRDVEGRGESALDQIFGKTPTEAETSKDVLMVDRPDSEAGEGNSDDNG